jgi:hypothetical protein
MITALLLLVTPWYDFAQHPAASKVIIYVKEQYPHRDKIDPKAMFRGAVDRLAADFPALKMTLSPTNDVTIDGRTVPAEKLDSLWSMSFNLYNLATAIAAQNPQLAKEHGPQMEHSMIHGMLAALDPAARFLVGEKPPPKTDGICQIAFLDDCTLLLPCVQRAR